MFQGFLRLPTFVTDFTGNFDISLYFWDFCIFSENFTIFVIFFCIRGKISFHQIRDSESAKYVKKGFKCVHARFVAMS